MKHRAFTLAEVVVALGVIGVIAAVLLPMINKFRPDTTKVLYLKTYDSLKTSILNLTNNENVYPTIDNSGNRLDPYVFLNLDDGKLGGQTINSGANKLCRALAATFDILEDYSEVTCNDSFTTTGGATTSPTGATAVQQIPMTPEGARTGYGGIKKDFTVKNGVEFSILSKASTSSGIYFSDIVIDTNGFDRGVNCVYELNNPTTCERPDRFTFWVGADGELIPTDPAGVYYLETRTNLKNVDITLNEKILEIFKENKENAKKLKQNCYVDPDNNNNNDGDNDDSGNKDKGNLSYEKSDEEPTKSYDLR